MLQWITALEKVAAASHYTGTNRFESFAPIRLNVAAQWLVDGVRIIYSKLYPAAIFIFISVTTFGIFPGLSFLLGNVFTYMTGG